MKGYMTISFSYVYLKGLHLGMGPSSPVVIDVHRLNLQLAKTLQKINKSEVISPFFNIIQNK